ncbi:hypothetical protein OESDEN_07275 [Oesophagostomum dentatum]|uniref:Uncharacterized protein n=1 Tax=Oesophagostomum dentatum TaxID=61180 RepID=A0A0B1TAI3_OESDE|nr:hypothetical protein OESDEN_07275 [Oesophagostomum dentatum]
MGSYTGTIQSGAEVSGLDRKEQAVNSDVAHEWNARDSKAKDTHTLECNICDLRSSTEGIGNEADVTLLHGKEEAVEAPTVSKGATHQEKAKETQKLKCNICEIHRRETSPNIPTNPEAVVNSSASCYINDRDVFLPDTKCPSEMNWIHQLETLSESAVASA